MSEPLIMPIRHGSLSPHDKKKLADAGGCSADWHNRRGRRALPVGDDLIGGKWRWLG